MFSSGSGPCRNTVDTERTFGIESSGLALLAAYCFEVLQEIHYFKEP